MERTYKIRQMKQHGRKITENPLNKYNTKETDSGARTSPGMYRTNMEENKYKQKNSTKGEHEVVTS